MTKTICRKISALYGSLFIFIGIVWLLLPRILSVLIGSLFISFGIIGLVLPFINGTLFLIIGLILLSFESKYVEKKLHYYTDKNTTLKKWHLYFERKLRKLFRKER